ncbi:MAG: hypothetical protein EXR78_09765 [Deltaproteobacteria bacterium]|nr:hypothetical protein [Deltaproteobacteria bacterium]
MDFKEWFCLNGRDSFTIDPKINAGDEKFFFGRDDIQKNLAARFSRAFIDPKVPKLVLYGAYGSGKTQTLFHIAYMLKTTPPRSLKASPRTIQLVVEMRSRSTHSDWHLQLMEALGKEVLTGWLELLFKKHQDFDKFVAQLVGEPNITKALLNIKGGGDIPLIAWRWLSGLKLTPAELQRLFLTRNLGDIGTADLVNVLVAIGKVAEECGEKLIFLVDEVESFHMISNADAINNVHDYLRRLASPDNATVGFVLSMYGLTADQVPEVVNRADVRTRIGNQNYIEIEPLPTIADVRRFTLELLSQFIDKTMAEKRITAHKLTVALETYPFEAGAFDLLCDYASQDPSKALPRNIIAALNECAISTWDAGKYVIEQQIVNDIAPIVFGS